MTPLYDEQQRRAAAQAERAHPGWAVLWGTHTRMYWGFPRFQAPPGTMIAAPDTAGLITRMQHTELAARAHMPPPASPGGNDSAWHQPRRRRKPDRPSL
jgi:hypothetical protein